jgi:DeoR family transcriptional regulator, copper-sensing transcriptional repressor
MSPTERHQQILSLLAEQKRVTIEELSETFGVSKMTIHRDLNHLETEGQLRKVHGGAILIAPSSHADQCPVCHTDAAARTQMVLHLTDERHQVTCCPHCGLLALATLGEQVVSAMVADFLFGRMVNARRARYLLAPELRLCCTPTVLAFERDQDARRFQAGFGGEILTMEAAVRALQNEMTLTFYP